MLQFTGQPDIPDGGNPLSNQITYSENSNVTSSNPNFGGAVAAISGLLIFFIVLYIVFIVISIIAFTRTNNTTLKVFLILGIFIPPISPVTLILALMVIFGGLK